jgi:hypothetical protein
MTQLDIDRIPFVVVVRKIAPPFPAVRPAVNANPLIDRLVAASLKMPKAFAPLMVSWFAPGPTTESDCVTAGSAAVSVIVPLTPVASIVFGPAAAFDCVMQYRKSPLLPLPTPASPVFVTVNVAGAMRFSSARSRSFARVGGRFAGRRRSGLGMGELGG